MDFAFCPKELNLLGFLAFGKASAQRCLGQGHAFGDCVDVPVPASMCQHLLRGGVRLSRIGRLPQGTQGT